VLPLHKRWQDYARGVLHGAPEPEAEDRLVGIDLHGCMLCISEAKDPRWRGLKGVVVRDSAETFQLVIEADRFVTVPKRGCIFEYDLDRRRKVTLLGDGLANRTAARRRGGSGGN
jgi:ribonuclease P protein subunit POP4